MNNSVLNNHFYQLLEYIYKDNKGYSTKILDYNLQLNIADLIEQLLLFDKIVFKINTICYPLIHLINEAGITLTRDFFENEPIKFAVWTAHYYHSADPYSKELDGKFLFPIVLAYLEEKDRNLDVIYENSLKYIKRKLSYDDKLFFKNYFYNNTEIISHESGSSAIEFTSSLYQNNQLKIFDLDFDGQLSNDFSLSEMAKLATIVMEIFTSRLLIERNIQAYNFTFLKTLSEQSISSINKGGEIISNNNQLLEINNIPNFKSLYLNHEISLQRALKFSRNSNSQNYKSWLSKVTEQSDSLNISKEYINAVLNKKNFLETTKGKFIKTIGIWGIGGLTGGIIGGLAGAVAGTTITAISEKTFDLSLSLWDTFYLDKVLKGWSPKIYFDEIESLRQKNSNTT